MSVNVEQVTVLQEDFFGPSQCADELNQINDSLQRREGLLAASARASRLLLEPWTCVSAIPDALRLIGDAGRVGPGDADAAPAWGRGREYVGGGI